MSYELFFIGLCLTLFFIALTGFYPGGIVVPAYLVLFINQPLRLIGTIAIALAVWLLYKWLSRYVILYGKRRFVLLLLLGAIGSFVLSFILPHFFPETIELKVIGWIIPGLIANLLEKQGLGITLSALAVMLVVLFGVEKVFYVIF